MGPQISISSSEPVRAQNSVNGSTNAHSYISTPNRAPAGISVSFRSRMARPRSASCCRII
ncbi:Uncharacterised protein [Mycobacteroides abscessus subsp. abscessus]|nr:Uncharacterised protein [Mycobacteroides abscessus subsp. abscessus]